MVRLGNSNPAEGIAKRDPRKIRSDKTNNNNKKIKIKEKEKQNWSKIGIKL